VVAVGLSKHRAIQAIAHHTRREILTLLKAGPKPVTDIVSRFQISQPAISQQLRVLLEASLVTAETVGRQRIYHLNAGRLRVVKEWVSRAVQYPSGHVWVFRGRPHTKKGS
jgi:DNA-binding transcriptional ArsR family regulator